MPAGAIGTGQPPFGYRTVTVEKHGNKEKKKLETEPKEAEIVRLIFQLYLFGDGKTGPLGIKDITSYLNAHGFTERSGKPFRIQFVHKMLTRVSYTGVHHFNRRDSRNGKPRAREEWVALEVPRLIEDDVFHAVQAQLKARHPKIDRAPDHQERNSSHRNCAMRALRRSHAHPHRQERSVLVLTPVPEGRTSARPGAQAFPSPCTNSTIS